MRLLAVLDNRGQVKIKCLDFGDLDLEVARNGFAGTLIDQVLNHVLGVAQREHTTGDTVTLGFRIVVAAFAGASLALRRVWLHRRHVDAERHALLSQFLLLVVGQCDLVMRHGATVARTHGPDNLATWHQRGHAALTIDAEHRFFPTQVGTGFGNLARALDALGAER